MSFIDQEIKVKAICFIDKLAEYTKNNNNILNTNIDLESKPDRILLNSSQIKELKELINKAKKQKDESDKLDIISKKITMGKLKYDPSTDSFSLKNTIIEKIYSPNRSTEFREIFNLSEKEYKKITANGLNNKNYAKIKANTFAKKISGLDHINTPVNNLINSNNKIASTISLPVFLDFMIGKTDKNYFIEVVNKFSNIKYNTDSQQNFLVYHDLSLIAYFSEDNILDSMEFSETFQGMTSKGLQMKDAISKVLKLYPKTIYDSDSKVKWNGMEITYFSSLVNSLTIYNNVETMIFKKNLAINKFLVYTEGQLLGIIIDGTTTSLIIGANSKDYVINFMQEYSQIKEINPKAKKIFYPDAGIIFYFDENEILTGIDFKSNFRGQTVKELKMGDNLDKVYNLYPNLKTNIDFVEGRKMKIFYENNIVTTITCHLK
ncbi:MAG: hypothetical protein H7263_18900 [Candidatus Sericytochromatia bacterium]|nr:hypothetical protein [Candidatus Sericytochromatia bacterium]